jgi:peptidoglycan/LPS O-acetylase OafA/YrhL
MNYQLSNTLNFLRWFAALMVVIGHLRSFLFVEYAQVEAKTIFVKMFYFITGFGHQAVIVFFVLSGYLVGGAVLQKYKKNEFTVEYIKKYFIKRFVRIYLVLIPALFIGYILDYYGNINFSDLYTNTFHISAMNNNVSENINSLTLFGNILNLQTIFVPTLGTNGPLWSLANEWSYYMLFILLFINNYTRIVFLGIVVLLAFQNVNILIYSSIWILGVSIILFKKHFFNRYLSLTFLLFIFLISRNHHGIYMDLMLSVAITLLINSFEYSILKKVYFKKVNTIMADFSYSLYLFHFPFFVFIIAFFQTSNITLLQLQPSLENFTIYLALLTSVYIYSYSMYLIFERNTDKINKYLIKRS